MFGPSRSPARSRLRLFLEELESRTLLSASIVDTLLAAPQTILIPAPLADVSAAPQRKPGGGGGSSPPPGFSPSQVQNAYGFNNITFNNGTKGDGTGQTIAIVDAYNNANAWSDLTKFDTQYQLATPSLTVMNQSGTVLSTNGSSTGVPPPSADPSGGWELEESLDVEWAHAMAPKANIVLVEANSSSLSDLMTAVQTAAGHAAVVSMSWGAGEFSGETSYDSYFTQANVTYVASSGDSGAPPIYPAISPNVVAVGGTSLTLNGSGGYSSETGWSGSGGGVSQYETLPSYQPGSYSNGSTTGTSTTRMSPDVAYDANPNTGYAVYDSTVYYPYYPFKFGAVSGWIEVGGTSAGAPQWSALIAIADQGRALDTSNNTPLGGVSQTLPALYNMSSSDFHDITNGTSTGTPNYTAGTGYDLVTGRGSPIANSVVTALVNANSTGGVGGLIATTSSGTSTPPKGKASVLPAGTPTESLSGSGTVSLVSQTLAATDAAILAQPTQTSTALAFSFGMVSVNSSIFSTGQTSAAPGGNIANQTSSSPATVPGFQLYAPAPRSVFNPAEKLGTYLSPFASESPDSVPLIGADDADKLWNDSPQVLPGNILVPLGQRDIDWDLAGRIAVDEQSEGILACDTCSMDEVSMVLIAGALAPASGEYEESPRLGGAGLALFGVFVSSFWISTDGAEESSKRRRLHLQFLE
jgi:subtilase family serine protease